LNLLDGETLWVFISGSDEDRFLDDILFGISCLQHRNIALDNIIIFVDQPSGMGFVSAHDFPAEINIYPTGELSLVLKDGKKEKITIIVTGHGNQNGICADSDIKPYELVSLVKKIKNLKYGLIVLGQCFAGTFNFLEVRTQNTRSKKTIAPEISIIGATDLHVSISSRVDISAISNLADFQCNQAWLANLFLFFFMYYVAFPDDTDGDGVTTVIDTYKAAGIGANQLLINTKQHTFLAMHDILFQHGGSQLGDGSIIQRLTQQAHNDYLEKSAIVLSAQTPWILHANFARRLTL
jgi:hypothetical protein